MLEKYKDILKLIKRSFSKDFFLDLFRIRRKPRTLQLPITSRCNSRCVTCNIWKLKERNDIDPGLLEKALSDPFFDEITAVGMNGGEVTMVPDFMEILKVVLTLKKLQAIYIISNGLYPDKLFKLLTESKKICNSRNVKLCFALSVDGYGNVHEEIRGIPKCFERTKRILDELKTNSLQYADEISIGCTLSKKNIAYVYQTDEFLKNYPFEVNFHLAVPNKRIQTFEDAADYYILNDKYSSMLASEFYYDKYNNAPKKDRFRYFCQYYFLINKGKSRLCRCSSLYQDVTIDENLNFYLCATASDAIGNLKTESASSLACSKRIKDEEKKVALKCDECIHYVYDIPTPKGLLRYFSYKYKKLFDWEYKFEILTK